MQDNTGPFLFYDSFNVGGGNDIVLANAQQIAAVEQQQQQFGYPSLSVATAGHDTVINAPDWTAAPPPPVAKTTAQGSSADSTYVLRIHEMLEDAERMGNTDIISWQKHGRAFKIHKEDEFVKTIMPRYFKAKIGSFRRWLRAWGFERVTEGPDRGSYYHRYFIRGVVALCRTMSRQQMQASMDNWLPPGQVPDFYAASLTALSETSLTTQANASLLSRPSGPHADNPKKLRGTILEDLRAMLVSAEEEGFTSIVSWMPHGKAFKIHSKDEFISDILPRFFKSSKLTYLSDSLRIWGFVRLKARGPDRGAYYHKYFAKNDPSLSRHRSRKQMKDAMADWCPRDGEPNLYEGHMLRETFGQDQTFQSFGAVPGTLLQTEGYSVSNLPPFPEPQQLDNSQATRDMSQNMPQQVGFHEGISESAAHAAPVNQINANHDQLSTFDSVGAEGTYVLRIHEMLEDAEKQGNSHIISWQPHGRAFKIHNEQEYVKKIMPRYFKAKDSSFYRWLRAWGFCRMTEGRDRGAWYHRYFVRGATDLCRNLNRQKMLKEMEGWLPAGQVPDFYAPASGMELSETSQEFLAASPDVQLVKNPKKLRGTVLENVRAMLRDAEEQGFASIVSWLPHGQAFKVHKKDEFVDNIMPRYIKAQKFTYFSDTLRIWGFARIKVGRDKGSYYHYKFVKGQPHLTRHLSRVQMRDCMAGFPPPEGEPDLYTQTWSGPVGTNASASGIAASVRDSPGRNNLFRHDPQIMLPPHQDHRAMMEEPVPIVHPMQRHFHQEAASLPLEMPPDDPLAPRMDPNDPLPI